MNYDMAIQEVGNLRNGFNMWLFFVLMFTSFRADPVTLMFVLMKPKNYTCDWVSSFVSQNISLNLLDNVPLSGAMSFLDNNNTIEEKCLLKLANNQTVKCTNWNFENNNSAISEFSLVCDRGGWPNALQGSIWIGTCCSIFTGLLFDKIGRRKPYIANTLIWSLFSFVAAASYNEWMLYIAMFIKGFTLSNCFIALIIMTEISNINSRIIIGNGCWSFYLIFYTCMPWLAYFVPYWRYMLYALAAKDVVVSIISFSMPESPRWLLLAKRNKEAQLTMDYLCKVNKVPKVDISKIEVTKQDKFSLKHFSHTKVFIRLLAVIFWWSAVSLLYYGITLNIDFAMDNPYIAQCLMGLCEIFGVPLGIGLVWKFGNKITIYFTAICTTIGLVSVYFLTNYVIFKLIFASIGKIGITTAFTVVINFTGETFSTDIRTSGQFFAWFSRLSIVAVPYIITAVDKYPFFPTLMFSIVGILLIISVIPFPETKGRPLCQQISELPPITWKNITDFPNKNVESEILEVSEEDSIVKQMLI